MTESERERRERFDALFAAHSADIVGYCRWRSGSTADAQDVAADVFLTAWRRLEDLPGGDAARVWLYATARRALANHRRSARRRVALHDRLTLHAAPASQAPPEGGETPAYEALRSLGPLDREVLLLAEWEGLTPAQIGAVVGCLAVTARGRLHRARGRFRAAYEELAAAGDGPPRRDVPDNPRSVCSVQPLS
jgi:RNA polymerase sigma-70 factor (ECF subfamily)